jgi:hypothetical protein
VARSDARLAQEKTLRDLYGVHVPLSANGTIGPQQISPLSIPNEFMMRSIRAQRGDWETMNNLDRFMEFLVAVVFLIVGLSKIFSYRYQKEPAEAGKSELAMEFPYWCAALVGLFEMGAAMALVTPFELALLAAVSLALSTIITGL